MIDATTSLTPLLLGMAIDIQQADQITTALQYLVQVWGGQAARFLPSKAMVYRAEGQNRRFTPRRLQHSIAPDQLPDYVFTQEETRYKLPGYDTVRSLEQAYNDDRHPRIGYPMEALLGHIPRLFHSSERATGVHTIYAIDERTSPLAHIIDVCTGSRAAMVTAYRETISRHYRVEIQQPSLHNLLNLLEEDKMTPLGLTMAGLQYMYIDPRLRSQLHILDETNPYHVAQLFNLRSRLADVKPVPLGYLDEFLTWLAERVIGDPKYGDSIEVIHVSDGCETHPMFTDFLGRYKAIIDSNRVPLGNAPDLWDDVAYRYFDNEIVPFAAREASSRVAQRHTWYEIPLNTLDLDLRKFGWIEALCANEIDVRISGMENAGLFVPSNCADHNVLFKAMRLSGFRLSETGFRVIATDQGDSVVVTIPDGPKAIKHYLKGLGVETETSVPGRLLQRLVAQIGDPLFAHPLSYEPIVKAIERMSSGVAEDEVVGDDVRKSVRVGKAMTVKRWQDICRAIEKGATIIKEDILDSLLSLGVFEIGFRIKCSLCGLRIWYSMSQLERDMQCPHCLGMTPFPQANPASGDWCYRTRGAFSIGDYARGTLVDLLLLRFLRLQLGVACFYSSGVTFTNEDRELDLLVFAARRTLSRRRDYIPLLCECKAYSRFEPEDFERLLSIHEVVPMSHVVLATFRREFIAYERDQMQKLERKLRARGPWSKSMVIPVTGNELFCRAFLSQHYKALGLGFEELAKQHFLDVGDFGRAAWNQYVVK